MAERQSLAGFNFDHSGNIKPKHNQAGHPEFSRRINRRIVMNLICRRQPLSRADLARASGLARCTVSMIVEQLIEERWVVEGPTGRLPLGRRPTLLKLNEDRTIVAVDLRPMEAIIALSDLAGKLGDRESVEMHPDRTAAIAQLIARIGRIASSAIGKSIEGIGVSLQGNRRPVEDRDSRSACPDRQKFGVGPSIADATGLEVDVDSAANACTLANAWFDDANVAPSTVVVTVSDEIQAGIFTNGHLVRGRDGMAGDYGHVQLDPNGPACACGGRGCWTVFASNRAALRYYSGPGKQPQGLTFTELLDMADRGDASAAKAVETMAYSLGLGFRTIVGSVAPDCILVVGDVTRSWDRLIPRVMAGLKAQPMADGQIPCILPVRDGVAARLRGAVALVLQRRFAAWEQGWES
jgi:predicted NBD/HSP70 family sugar kinase